MPSLNNNCGQGLQAASNQICGQPLQSIVLRNLAPAALAQEMWTCGADALAKGS